MLLTLESLNENQSAAVKWNRGPLLVLAGPGSGKTAVLAWRIADIISESPTGRFRVVGLTFTNKAAIEMRERVNSILATGSERALLTTFHAFAADILRQHGSHLGLSPDFSILNSDDDRLDIFEDAVRLASTSNENISEADVALLPLLTNLIEKRVDEQGVGGRVRDPELASKLTTLYQAYVHQLKEHNALDFPLLISLAGQLLTENPAIARHYRTVYPHVCVDEFQDTNVGQFEFLKALVGNDPSGLFVVADDDQIVYQWNGASPERLTDLRNTFDISVIELPENYRCPQPIIEVANKLIGHNPNRAKSSFTPTVGWSNKAPEPIRVKCLQSPEDEADWVAKDLLRIPVAEREHCAVLGRTKTIVERVAASLSNKGIPSTLSVKKNEFVSTPLRWLHSMLRLANSRGDKEQLRKVCKAFYELEGVQLAPKDVVAASSAMGGDLFRAWIGEASARKPYLDERCIALLNRAKTELGDRMIYGPFVKQAFEWFEFLSINDAPLGRSDTVEAFADYPEEHKVWTNICESINLKHSTDEASLNLLLQEMDLMPKQPTAPPNSVRCYTIHTAKGMEFDYVYVVGLAEDILPSYQSIRRGPESREIQEERRNCFVAITRTRKCLTLTRSQAYFGYEKQPSRFLREMGLPIC
jgi:DNA helicase II / ATP-dependent DNA helicase PcrA